MVDKTYKLVYTLSNGRKTVHAVQSVARAIRKKHPEFQIVQVSKHPIKKG